MATSAQGLIQASGATGGARLSSRRFRDQALGAILYVVLTVLGFTFLLPLLWVLTTSLKYPAQVFIVPIQWLPTDPQWHNYVDIFTLLPLARFALNSIVVATTATLGTVLSAAFVAYSLSRLRWPGRNPVFVLLLATMMLPGVVTMVPTFIVFRTIGWIDTYMPLIVPNWFGGGAFFIFLMRQFFTTLPYELEEAARIDGAGSLRILWQLVMPLSRPVIATVAIFSFLNHYNDFMGPLIYLNSNEKFTLPLGLYWLAGRYGDRWPYVMAASTVMILPVIIIFFLAQRQFIRGIQLTGLGGR